jgi:hypothetical protein
MKHRKMYIHAMYKKYISLHLYMYLLYKVILYVAMKKNTKKNKNYMAC